MQIYDWLAHGKTLKMVIQCPLDYSANVENITFSTQWNYIIQSIGSVCELQRQLHGCRMLVILDHWILHWLVATNSGLELLKSIKS